MDLLTKTKTVIRALLFSSPKSLTINELDDEFAQSEDYRIPFQRLGHSSLRKFLLSIPDVLKLSYFDETVFPVTENSRSEHIHKYVSSSSSIEPNPFNKKYGYQRPHPRIKLEYLSRSNVTADNLNEKMKQLQLETISTSTIDFSKENEVPLTVTDKQENSKNELSNGSERENVTEVEKIKELDKLEESAGEAIPFLEGVPLTVTDKQENSKNELSNGSERENVTEVEEIKELDKLEESDVEAIPFLEENDPVHLIGVPTTDYKIPDSSLSDLEAKRTYNVIVMEIDRPWKFYFCLLGATNTDDLMDDQLKWHYTGEKLPMDVSEMITGTACLVSYGNKVLRAELLAEPIDDKVKVCFVDYGTITVVRITECRRINKYFASIPKRCYTGALELIEPTGSAEDDLKLVQRFWEMVRNKPLCGYVNKIDHENAAYRLILIDTSDDTKDVIINRQLLADNFE